MIQNTRGAVSVFLVIILVPCMLVTSIFVDYGRVKLSKSMAYSSSDLALNTLMTNYDRDLNEWYGMVVSCQNIDEFYQISSKFFLRTLSSQGLSDEEIILVSDQWSQLLGNDTIYDLLPVKQEEDVKISAVENANLANSTMLKRQVVEFMKYRAPITVTEELIERLTSDHGLRDLKESDENKPLVDAKEDYFEKEGELLEKAYDSYRYLYDEYTSKGITNEQMQGNIQSLENARKMYQEIYRLMISNLYNTQGLSVFYRPVIALDAYEDDYDYSSVSSSKLADILEDAEDAIEEFEKAKDEVVTDGGAISYGSDTNDIQYWVKLNQAINPSSGSSDIKELKKAGEKMLKTYSKMNAMNEAEREDGVPDGYDADYSEYKTTIENYQRKYLTSGVSVTGDSYLTMVNRLETISANNINNISSSTLRLSNGNTIDAQLAEIAETLSGIKKELKDNVDILDHAINGKWGVPSLSKLSTLASEYHNKYAVWKNTANDTDTSMGEEDRAEIQKIDEEAYAEINSESVQEMQTRLGNIRSQFQEIIDVIDSMKWNGKKLTDIKNFNTFKNKAGSAVSVNDIPTDNSGISSYADSTFDTLFYPDASEKTPVVTLHTEENYSAELNPETGRVCIPQLYQYMHQKFKNANDDDVKGGKSQKKGAEDKAKNAEENALTGRYEKSSAVVNAYGKTASEIEQAVSAGGDPFSLGDGIGGIVDLVTRLADGNLASIRDNLYLSIYMREMFSYATYENEGRYQLLKKYYKENDGSVDKIKDLNQSNYAGLYTERNGNADTESTWMSTDFKDAYNKSLTNKMISPSGNAAYGCELEYILYGKSNKENVQEAYKDIFAVRYALNYISAFQRFWGINTTTGKAIDAASTALSAATSGIIPVPVIKIVLLALLTALETVRDLNRLEAGFPVEIYKTADDWQYSLQEEDGKGGFSVVVNKLTELSSFTNNDSGIFYSDYLTLFICLGMQSGKSEDMCKRMADLIQQNMRVITGKDNYSLSNAKTYFQLEATLRVNPIMISLPIFSDYVDESDKKGDWCTYQIRTVRGY